MHLADLATCTEGHSQRRYVSVLPVLSESRRRNQMHKKLQSFLPHPVLLAGTDGGAVGNDLQTTDLGQAHVAAPMQAKKQLAEQRQSCWFSCVASGVRDLAGMPWKSPNACSAWPPFSQALMAALHVLTCN